MTAGLLIDEEPACRVCGCTELAACPGGCWWVTDPEMIGDLCSACADIPPRRRTPADVASDPRFGDCVVAAAQEAPEASVVLLARVAAVLLTLDEPLATPAPTPLPPAVPLDETDGAVAA